MSDPGTVITIDDESSHFDDSTDFESEVKTRCCWCRRFVALLPKQKHCKDCDSKAFRLCSRCHVPFPDPKYFKLNANRCDSCQRKYLKEKLRRAEKQKEREAAAKSSDEEQKNEKIDRPEDGSRQNKLKRKITYESQPPRGRVDSRKNQRPAKKTISDSAATRTNAALPGNRTAAKPATSSSGSAKEDEQKKQQERRMEDEILIWPSLKFDGTLKAPHPKWVMLPLFVLTDKKEETNLEPQQPQPQDQQQQE